MTRKRKTTTPALLTVTSAALILGGGAGHAATIAWSGGDIPTSTSWNATANWSGGVLPGSGDIVTFGSTGLATNRVVTLDAPQTIYQLSIPAWVNAPAFTIGSANDVAAGNSLTLTNVYREDNSSNADQTIVANVVLAADSTWAVNQAYGGSLVVKGAISGAGKSLNKWGSGSLALSGANSYSGMTTVNAGSLKLDFNTSTSPLTNILLNTTTVQMNGSTLTLGGKATAGTANSQTLAGLDIASGAATVSITNGATGNSVLFDVGALTRSKGATLNLTVTSVISSTNGYKTSTGNDASGILGGWATISGTTWATNNGTNIVAYTGYTDLSGATPTLADGAVTNVRITNGSSGDIGLASGTTTVNTLLMNDTAVRTLTIGAGNTLRLGAAGGVLTSGTSLVIGAAGNAGSLTAGGADDTAGEIVFTNAKDVTVNAAIADNGTGAVTLTKAGAGTLTLTSAATYSGGTFVNSGTLTLSGGNNLLNSAGSLTVNGGTLNLGTGSHTIAGEVSIRGGTISSGTIFKSGSDYNAWAGTVTATLAGSVGLVKTTPGVLTLNKANLYTGTTLVLEGSVVASADGAVKGNIVVGSSSDGLPANFTVAANVNPLATAANVTVYSNGRFYLDNDVVNNVTINDGYFNFKYGKVNNVTISGGNFDTNTYGGTINGSITMTGGLISGAAGFDGTHSAITTNASSSTAVIAAKNSMGANNTFTVADGAAEIDLRVTGTLTGANRNVTKAGAGMMTLEAISTYTGVTAVNAGTLSVAALTNGGANSGIGASTNAAANLVLNGGTLQYTGAAASTDRLFTLGTTAGSALDASGSGALTFNNTGTVGLSGTGARTFTLTGSNTDDNTLAAVLVDNSGANKTSLVKNGAGKWVLSGANLYTGSTLVNAGTLKAGNATAFGTGTVYVAGGVLDLTANNVGNVINITGTGASVRMAVSADALTTSLANGSLYAGWSRGSSLTNGTTAAFAGGTATAARTVTTSWSSDPHGSGNIVSDVLNLSGTTGDVIVLQLTYADGELNDANAMLGYWKDSTSWVNAIYGGSYSGAGTFVDGAYNGSLDLGTWGRDSSSNTVWAVVDHNSEFAVVVPEPATLALLGLGALAFLRRRKHG